ncbi:MAG: hypothetical protein ACOZIN_20585 [Myxococcota bacterium]
MRCPSCGIIVLRRERFDPDRHHFGAPDFCPKCGERVRVDPSRS